MVYSSEHDIVLRMDWLSYEGISMLFYAQGGLCLRVEAAKRDDPEWKCKMLLFIDGECRGMLITDEPEAGRISAMHNALKALANTLEKYGYASAHTALLYPTVPVRLRRRGDE